MNSPLINDLFPINESNAIRSLWADKRHQAPIKEAIGKQIIDSDRILTHLPLTQLMFITSLSPFASDEECVLVASIIYWGIDKDVMPLITENTSKELAYKCLIALSLFKKALIKRHNHGAPNPNFYRGVGIASFKIIGMPDISSHFNQWTNFLPEMLII